MAIFEPMNIKLGKINMEKLWGNQGTKTTLKVSIRFYAKDKGDSWKRWW